MGCRANRSTNLSLNNGSETEIALTTEDFDTDGFHTSTNAYFTVPTGGDGYYQISGYVGLSNNTSGSYRYLRLYINAGNLVNIQMPFSTNVGTGASVSTTYHLAATDTVRLKVYVDQNSMNCTEAWLSIARIGT
jgi:hypothetical protein